jgi:hypothetical protein
VRPEVLKRWVPTVVVRLVTLYFAGGIEHREEAAHDGVEDLALRVGERLRDLARRDQGEVVGDLAVVEDALVGLDPAVGEHLARKAAVFVRAVEHAERLAHRGHVILGQRHRFGSRIAERLVLFIERLADRGGGLGGETEAPEGVALQRHEAEKLLGVDGDELRRLFDRARAAAARVGHGAGLLLAPEALGLELGMLLVLLEVRVLPKALVGAVLAAEARRDFPVVLRLEAVDLVFAVHHDRERGRLHAADGREEEASVLGVEGRHGAGAVDADEPVGLGAAARGRLERLHLLVGAQLLEGVADRLVGHRLQPQAAHRLLALAVLHDVAEDQLALAPGIAGVDDVGHLAAPEHFRERLELVLGLLDGLEIEVRRQHRQVLEGPAAALDVEFLGALISSRWPTAEPMIMSSRTQKSPSRLNPLRARAMEAATEGFSAITKESDIEIRKSPAHRQSAAGSEKRKGCRGVR